MPIIQGLSPAIKAIQEITNGSSNNRRPPRGGVPNGDGARTEKASHKSPNTEIMSEKQVVNQIVKVNTLKANAKVIETADEMIGTILDIKV